MVVGSVSERIWKILEAFTKENSVILKQVNKIETVSNNFRSDVIKCQLEGVQVTNAGDQSCFRMNVVVKEIPKDKEYVDIYNCSKAFINENLFYNEILNNMTRFSARPLPVPKCIYVSDSIIILEDLAEKDYEHLDVLKGLTVEEVKLILSELANFHAASFKMQHEDRKSFNAISKLCNELIYLREKDTMLLTTQEKCLKTLIDILNGQNNSSRFKNHLKVLHDLKETARIKQVELITRTNKFPVINHGDLWTNNIMFNKENKIIKFLDFQTIRCTSVAADLNYFLYVNLDPDFRMQYKDVFLIHYLNELHKNIGDLPIKNDLTMEWLYEEMCAFSSLGLICAICILPVFYHKSKKEKTAVNTRYSEGMVPEEKYRLIRLVSSYIETNGFY